MDRKKLLTKNVSGSYLDHDWAVVDAAGTRCEDRKLLPGRYIVTEDAYSAVVLMINSDMTLSEVD